MHATINLVPSLLVQLRQIRGGARGHAPCASRDCRPTGCRPKTCIICSTIFSWSIRTTMIRPFPRYNELYEKRGFGIDPAERAAQTFFEPRHHRSAMLVESGLDSSAGVRAATPTWPSFAPRASIGRKRKSMAAGQADGSAATSDAAAPRTGRIAGRSSLSTTPFYHPILPLLWDKRLARQAMPDVQLPQHLEGYAEDAEEHIRRAVEFHTRAVRPEAARHVALGRLGLPGHHSGHGRGRHRMDRHRRGNSLLLDRRLGLARRQRLLAQSRKCSIGRGAWRRRAAACKSCSATTP